MNPDNALRCVALHCNDTISGTLSLDAGIHRHPITGYWDAIRTLVYLEIGQLHIKTQACLLRQMRAHTTIQFRTPCHWDTLASYPHNDTIYDTLSLGYTLCITQTPYHGDTRHHIVGIHSHGEVGVSGDQAAAHHNKGSCLSASKSFFCFKAFCYLHQFGKCPGIDAQHWENKAIANKLLQFKQST